MTLLKHTLDQLRAEYAADGKERLFAELQQYLTPAETERAEAAVDQAIAAAGEGPAAEEPNPRRRARWEAETWQVVSDLATVESQEESALIARVHDLESQLQLLETEVARYRRLADSERLEHRQAMVEQRTAADRALDVERRRHSEELETFQRIQREALDAHRSDCTARTAAGSGPAGVP